MKLSRLFTATGMAIVGIAISIQATHARADVLADGDQIKQESQLDDEDVRPPRRGRYTEIDCQSWNYQPAFCHIGRRVNYIVLVQQYSHGRGRCIARCAR